MSEAQAGIQLPPRTTISIVNRILYWLYIPYIVAFVTVLFFAYKRIMDVNQSGSLYSIVVPFAIITFIYFLVCHAGSAICELFFFPRPAKAEARRWQWASFWFWFVILLLTSAYGVFSSLLLYIEGPIIMRESLSDARVKIIRLENVANAVLAHPEWDKYVSQVRGVEQRLHEAILPDVSTGPSSSHYCGFSKPNKPSQSRQRVADLQNLFRTSPPAAVSPCPVSDPSAASGTGYGCGFVFEVTNGDDVDNDCAHKDYFRSLQRKYDALVEQTLAQHPDRAKMEVPEKDALREAIVNRTTADGGVLSNGLSQLQGVVTFFPDLTLYYLSSKIYAIVSQHYSESYNRLLRFASADTLGLPPELEAPAVDEIATPWRVPDVVVARAGHATTWIYLGLAVAIDLVASLLAANVVYVLTLRHLFLLYAMSVKKVAGSDVSYIWRPEPNPR